MDDLIRTKDVLLRGYCTSYPKISMFCALSQNYQHFSKNNAYILWIRTLLKNSEIASKFK